MNQIQRYIFTYFPDALTDNERAAWKSAITKEKIRSIEGTHQATLMRKNWISADPEVLALLAEGDEIFFNYCPKCQALAHTPKAKQCPKCFYSWHELSSDKIE